MLTDVNHINQFVQEYPEFELKINQDMMMEGSLKEEGKLVNTLSQILMKILN
jgi:hypothetical protein